MITTIRAKELNPKDKIVLENNSPVKVLGIELIDNESQNLYPEFIKARLEDGSTSKLYYSTELKVIRGPGLVSSVPSSCWHDLTT